MSKDVLERLTTIGGGGLHGLLDPFHTPPRTQILWWE